MGHRRLPYQHIHPVYGGDVVLLRQPEQLGGIGVVNGVKHGAALPDNGLRYGGDSGVGIHAHTGAVEQQGKGFPSVQLLQYGGGELAGFPQGVQVVLQIPAQCLGF